MSVHGRALGFERDLPFVSSSERNLRHRWTGLDSYSAFESIYDCVRG